MLNKMNETILNTFKKGLLFSLSFALLSCAEDEPEATASFLKIYDDSDPSATYSPLDVVEMSDGYMILTDIQVADSDFRGTQLIKVDEEGNYENTLVLEDFLAPVGNMYLNPSDSNCYFFAMEPLSFQGVLVGISAGMSIEAEIALSGIQYPLAAAETSAAGSLLLLSYDNLDEVTEFSFVQLSDGAVTGQDFSIGVGESEADNVLGEISDHFINESEQPLPFFCGEIAPGSYFFNGFYDYNMSLVFTDLTSSSPSSQVSGQGSDAGVRAAMSVGGNNFAIAGYQFSENFQLSSVGIDVSSDAGITSEDLQTGDMADLKSYTPTKIISYTSGDTYTVFAAETEARQIVLYFYNSSTGQMAGLHRIGFINPFSFSSIKVTEDNSLLVLGTTYAAGRFERIVLNKISEGEVSSFLN